MFLCYGRTVLLLNRLCGAVVLAVYSVRHRKGYTCNPLSQVVQSLLHPGLFVLAMKPFFRYQFKQITRESTSFLVGPQHVTAPISLDISSDSSFHWSPPNVLASLYAIYMWFWTLQNYDVKLLQVIHDACAMHCFLAPTSNNSVLMRLLNFRVAENSIVSESHQIQYYALFLCLVLRTIHVHKPVWCSAFDLKRGLQQSIVGIPSFLFFFLAQVIVEGRAGE